jgi:hypothetical protein
MPDPSGFQPDHAAVARFLNSDDVSKAMLNAGQRVQRTAESIAPRGRSGSYASSFHTNAQQVPTLSRTGGASIRAGAAVTNSSPQAGQVEKSRHVLKRAARQAKL